MTERKVDQSAIRTNQALMSSLLLLAFIVDALWLVAFVGAVLLAGAIFPQLALFKGLYWRVLKPLGIVRPDVRPDNPEPHRFAMGVAGLVAATSAALIYAGIPVAGWALSWVDIVLGALSLTRGICMGCVMYYWFHRLGLPGFNVAPIRQGR